MINQTIPRQLPPRKSAWGVSAATSEGPPTELLSSEVLRTKKQGVSPAKDYPDPSQPDPPAKFGSWGQLLVPQSKRPPHYSSLHTNPPPYPTTSTLPRVAKQPQQFYKHHPAGLSSEESESPLPSSSDDNDDEEEEEEGDDNDEEEDNGGSEATTCTGSEMALARSDKKKERGLNYHSSLSSPSDDKDKDDEEEKGDDEDKDTGGPR
ncbi:hypothetical protein JTE90_024475 [Oedothorax gibbosus]|uniref:Uncharacterized protein n=1 Tax=Oedothorax gibbosus TaxID=931172 RepID=A0AAV6UK12_9ARAC|nr:hypothetical protein JTE90_024475 [Oedothorax gibbosus]